MTKYAFHTIPADAWDLDDRLRSAGLNGFAIVGVANDGAGDRILMQREAED